MGVNPLVAIERGETPASAAVWWAGVAIGAFNLIPVLPLDGGNVVTSVLDYFAPGKARRWMTYASVVITAGAALVFTFFPSLRGLVVFLGLLLLMQLQGVFEDREDHAVSIFDNAAAALRAGDEAKAARIVTRGMRKPSTAGAGADTARRRRAASAARRPAPPAADRRPVERVRPHQPARARRRTTARRRRTAPSRMPATPQPLLAATIARAAGGLGDEATAIAWLRAAVNDGASAAGRADGHRPRTRAGGAAPAARRSRRCARRSSPPGLRASRREAAGCSTQSENCASSRGSASWMSR